MTRARTFLLLSVLTAIFVCGGYAAAGRTGVLIALGLATVMNFSSWWFSDRFVLGAYDARQLSVAEVPGLFRIVQRLARRAHIPMPRLYLIPERAPNAFATGRNPEHGAIAVTEGLLRLMNESEIEGVLAHEMAHIRNRDTLLMSIAATISGAIGSISNFLLWGSLAGVRGEGPSAQGIVSRMLALLVAPIAAALLQLGISRTREFAADETAAELTADPMALATALEKIDAWSRHIDFYSGSPETAALFIQNPFPQERFNSLFRSHPRTQDRVARLRVLARRMRLAA